METEIGQQLFFRHAQGVTATPAAERIRPLIARITSLMEDIKSSARDIGTPAGSLVIGAPEATMALGLSSLLTEFSRTWKNVRLVVTPGTCEDLLSEILERRIEGAIVVGTIEHEEIHKELLFTDELVLITSRNVRSLDQLTKLHKPKAIVFGRGCPYRKQIDSLLRELGVTAEHIEFGSLDAIVTCVSAGVGVALLPKGAVSTSTRNRLVTAHRLPQEQAMVGTSFIYRRTGCQSSALAAFLDLARRMYSSREESASLVRETL